MNTQTKILASPETVQLRILSLLGWTLSDLMEVVSCMVGARNSCTFNDVPAARGTRAYLDGTRRLREIGLKYEGWEINDDFGIGSIVNEERGLKIVVCNTNEGTGCEDSHPENRNKKGAATSYAVSDQLLLGNILNEAVTDKPVSEGQKLKLWVLAVYCDDHDEVRAELACPNSLVNGFFGAFEERIILQGPGEGAFQAVSLEPEGDSGFEITVTRKA